MPSAAILSALADAVLVAHLGIILFNVLGMIVIPLGARQGWKFVRRFGWRALHLGILAAVAIQALFGRVCFLTIWHDDLVRLAGGRPSYVPLIASFVSHLIFWPLAPWAFVVLYVSVCAYTLALWRLVPPVWPRRLVS